MSRRSHFRLFNPAQDNTNPEREQNTYGFERPAVSRIGGPTRVSPVDQRELASGTRASVPFVPRGGRQGLQSMSNAQPDSAMSPSNSVATQPPPSVRVSAKPLTGPGGNRATDAANLAQNKSLYAAHDAPSIPKKATPVTPSAIATNSPYVQGLLDKAAGITPTTPTNTGTAYGTGSVRFDKGTPSASAPIVDASGKQTGVGRTGASGQPFDVNASRAELAKGYPEVFQAGTPENKAFVDYAKQYGEQSAHEHRGEILGQVAMSKQQEGDGGAGRGEAESDPVTQGQQSIAESEAGQRGERQAATAKAAADAGPFDPNSVGGKALSAVKNAPSIADAAGSVVTRGAKAIGLNEGTANSAGNAVRDFGNDVTDKVANLFTPSVKPVASEPKPPATPPPAAPSVDPSSPLVNVPPPVTAAANATLANNPPREDEVPNYAAGFEPQNMNPQMTREAADWKANMQSGMNALKADDAAAGFPDQAIGSSTLAGGSPTDSVPGYSPQNFPGTKVPNFAKGKPFVPAKSTHPMPTMPAASPQSVPVPPNYAVGKLFAPAMKREATAIQNHVGGAPASAKPVPVMMSGRPAVLNSSEAVMPTPQGPAVLNRRQQKRLPSKSFAPSRN